MSTSLRRAERNKCQFILCKIGYTNKYSHEGNLRYLSYFTKHILRSCQTQGCSSSKICWLVTFCIIWNLVPFTTGIQWSVTFSETLFLKKKHSGLFLTVHFLTTLLRTMSIVNGFLKQSFRVENAKQHFPLVRQFFLKTKFSMFKLIWKIVSFRKIGKKFLTKQKYQYNQL